MRLSTGRPLKFKIYPSNRSRLYFSVVVFHGCREMRAFHRARRGYKRTTVDGKWLGLCTSWGWVEKNGVRKYYYGKEVGEILLWRKRLGAAVVTHECTHAMFGLLRRWRIKLPDDVIGWPEERSCYALGEMVRKIYDKLYENGVLS